jgi:ribonuclease III
MLYNIENLEQTLEYTFQNKNLIIEALTHPSKKLENKNIKSYQRLEFLGDKILNFIIANALFEMFPNENEGEISQRHSHIVSGKVCFLVAQKLNILQHVIFSNAQKNDNSYSQPKVGEDTIEAIIGAIFLDSTIEKAKDFILKHWQEHLNATVKSHKDPKNAIQEYFQKNLKMLPEYKITEQNNIFTAKLIIGKNIFSGSGKTKKDAEKQCANNALDSIFN